MSGQGQFVTDFGPALSVFFRDPDGLEGGGVRAQPRRRARGVQPAWHSCRPLRLPVVAAAQPGGVPLRHAGVMRLRADHRVQRSSAGAWTRPADRRRPLPPSPAGRSGTTPTEKCRPWLRAALPHRPYSTRVKQRHSLRAAPWDCHRSHDLPQRPRTTSPPRVRIEGISRFGGLHRRTGFHDRQAVAPEPSQSIGICSMIMSNTCINERGP